MTQPISQYKLLFSLSWIILYIIFPAWALPISVSARASVFLGLILFFIISTILMDRWFTDLAIDEPIIKPLDLPKHLKNNLLLVIVCCIAAILHIRPLFFPILIIGDEIIHIGNGLWIYQYIDSSWHSLVQATFWLLIGLLLLIRKKRAFISSIFKRSSNNLSSSAKSNLKYTFVFLAIALLAGYFILIKDMTYSPSSIRYPPVSKFLYYLSYSAFGIDRLFPRIIQLIFNLLSAIYIYRTINLFHDKEAAIIGASIYLFLPVAFAYAHLGELINGTIFFIVAISYYFIRFFKDGENRDLVIATYLIGLGFLYKKPVLLVFIVCFIFLVLHKIRPREQHSLTHLKVLMLSLVPVIPWTIISKYFSWRNYEFHLSNFTSFDSKIVNYILLVRSNISEVIFVLFTLSVVYICFLKRNTLTVFFGLLFIVYYFFMVSDVAGLSPRFSMTFYPTIAVFLSLFISHIVKYVKWRYAFKLCFIVLTTYLIVISSVSPLKNRFLTLMNLKLHYYPSEEAMQWVKNNVRDEEKVLTVRVLSSMFYQHKFNIDKEKVIDLIYDMDDISTPEKLAAFYREHNISYIMFPGNPPDAIYNTKVKVLNYLTNNPFNEFAEVVKFKRGDNAIYIYKLNDNQESNSGTLK